MSIIQKYIWSETKFLSSFKFLIPVPIGIGLLGLSVGLKNPSVSPVLWVIGLFLGIGGLLLYLYKSRPPKKWKVEDIKFEEKPIEDLKKISPEPIKVALTGESQVGKTSLIRNIFLEEHPENEEDRTRRTTVRFSNLHGKLECYIALIDGPGQSHKKQFDLIVKGDILLIMMDHHKKHNRFSRPRMGEISSFLAQLREALADTNKRFKQIHIVLNKSDQWEKLSDGQIKKLKFWFKEEVDKWDNAKYTDNLTWDYHSNKIANQTAGLIKKLNLKK